MPILKFSKFIRDVEDAKKDIYFEMKKKEDIEDVKKLKERYDIYDKITHPGGHISRDVMVTTGASVAMLLLTLHYEKLDIITSKCWSWIKPPKN